MIPLPGRIREWLAVRSASARLTWRSTDALRRGLLLGPGLIVAGLLVHRVELVLCGAPLLLGSMVALARPVSGTPRVTVGELPRTVEAGQRGRLTVRIEPGPGTELVAVRLPRPDRPGPGSICVVPASVPELAVPLRWEYWGRVIDHRPDFLVTSADALLIYGPVLGAEGLRTVLPPVRPLPSGPLPPRTAGLVGAHRSPRPGDGVELRDIRPFHSGDRLRRIDWRVSLRMDSLYIRERHAEADADVVLAVDTRVDVGAVVDEWSEGAPEAAVRPGGSLDTAMTAAASLGAAYLRQGDRVGLVDLGRPQLGLPVGAGRRQLLKLRHQLVACAASAGWASRPVLRAEQVPPGSLVVVLSPFLDDEVVEITVRAARRGALVLAVDVLPAPLRSAPPDRDRPWNEAVLRMLTLEHDIRLAALRSGGVPVVPWGDGSTVPAMLRDVARPRRKAGTR